MYIYVHVCLFHPLAYGIQATLAPTFVEDVFGGKLVSTVTCQECETVSYMYMYIYTLRVLYREW